MDESKQGYMRHMAKYDEKHEQRIQDTFTNTQRCLSRITLLFRTIRKTRFFVDR